MYGVIITIHTGTWNASVAKLERKRCMSMQKKNIWCAKGARLVQVRHYTDYPDWRGRANSECWGISEGGVEFLCLISVRD
jgi:hypothetical protein